MFRQKKDLSNVSFMKIVHVVCNSRPDSQYIVSIPRITKRSFTLSFRSVSQSTNTHTGIGTLRNGTKRENLILFKCNISEISKNHLLVCVHVCIIVELRSARYRFICENYRLCNFVIFSWQTVAFKVNGIYLKIYPLFSERL